MHACGLHRTLTLTLTSINPSHYKHQPLTLFIVLTPLASSSPVKHPPRDHSLMASLSFLVCSFAVIAVVSLCLLVDGDAHHHVVDVAVLLPSDSCATLQGTSKDHKGMKVVNRHGPCSPLGGREKKLQQQEEILDSDKSRVESIQRRWRHKSPSASLAGPSIPAHTGDSLNTGNYIVTVGFGTPKRDLSVVFDTGSDVTWIQCQPCVGSCYPQQEPIFDPSQSSTYSNISCTSPFCSQLDTSGCSGSTCLYAVQYGDNSQTVGFFAEETLTLSPSDVLPKFRFGCGEKNSGLFGKAAGLLGLGRNPVSVVSQSLAKYGGLFSYCLPSKSSSTGYLSFGGAPPPNAQFTPMLTDPNNPSFYFLNLTAINVGGMRLSIPPTAFSTAGTIIDSGTVITRLPPTAYSALRAAFRQAMTAYPRAQPLSILDTCYDFTGYSNVTLPTVALVFGGGLTLTLDVSGVLYVSSVSQTCLAFAGNTAADDICIIGNTQQQTFDVVYDLSKKVVGFSSGACS